MERQIWKERYLLSLNESFSVKDIQMLRGVGQPTALDIRKECLNYCENKGIKTPQNKVPAEALFAVTHKGISYYEEKMIKENQAYRLYN